MTELRIFIDADGCPVVDETVRLAKEFGLECTVIADTSHVFDIEGVNCITVSKGADSADLRLVNLLEPGDIAVTQDYGLAALCLARRAVPIDQNGVVYDDSNIDGLLAQRAAAKRIRNAGGRLKGPKKRTKAQDEEFERTMRRILSGEGEAARAPQ